MMMTINVYAKFPSGRVQIQGLDWSSDKKVEWDPDVERVLLPSGKPLVPEYAMRFVGGSFSKLLILYYVGLHLSFQEDRRSVDEAIKHPYFSQSMAVNGLMFMVAVGFNVVARKMAAKRQSSQQVFSKGAYFCEKIVWAKGYRDLIDLLAKHKSDLDGFNMDVFGNGEYAHEVQTIAWTLNLNVNFMKGRDHANDSLYRANMYQHGTKGMHLPLVSQKESAENAVKDDLVRRLGMILMIVIYSFMILEKMNNYLEGNVKLNMQGKELNGENMDDEKIHVIIQ
ncbi:Digalactosyldiacylglycerol synthase 1, chloroplastic [Capsicum baccatum]|uniref:Digalactosyldiacylglycerol synthase 1, chloroplastic n=1 Tax=Capsicum baccatum TaxID=33114 RepID=A0A2G2VM21_CAPBA|nr:Digalactosyldiacylglycerol synthase 1, chloroplastic [Capsicum baccatum]